MDQSDFGEPSVPSPSDTDVFAAGRDPEQPFAQSADAHRLPQRESQQAQRRQGTSVAVPHP